MSFPLRLAYEFLGERTRLDSTFDADGTMTQRNEDFGFGCIFFRTNEMICTTVDFSLSLPVKLNHSSLSLSSYMTILYSRNSRYRLT